MTSVFTKYRLWQFLIKSERKYEILLQFISKQLHDVMRRERNSSQISIYIRFGVSSGEYQEDSLSAEYIY